MFVMRFQFLVLLTLFFAPGISIQASAAQDQPVGSLPVNPNASPEARALLAYLHSISGKAIIAGQHNYPNVGARWTDMAYDLTGKYPGLFGGDFGFSGGDDKDSTLSRPAMIEEAERQYQNGAVIALTWHEVRPTDDEPVTFHDSVQGKLTDYEWRELLTPGTPLYNRWCAQVDVIAGYLKQLRDAHVPVLFRPYHEINGNWFWWTGRTGKEGSAALYRQLYDRFVNVHHLNNLVWVWNVNAPNPGWPPIAAYYPGADVVDVVSMDIYGEFKPEYYNSMLDLAAGKPIALAEVGALPSPEVLEQQPRWAYFMVWSEFIQNASSPDQAKAVYDAARTLTRDDPRLSGPMAAIRKNSVEGNGAEPVSPGASAEARKLLERLTAQSGENLLAGQENEGAEPGSSTAAVVKTTGKQPAIYSTDLGIGSQSAALVQQTLAAHQSKALVKLNWRPALPTDGSPADKHSPLTDYEWNQLLTSGSALNARWLSQVDAVAATLQELDKADIAVLWNPLPESNGKNFWWAGRKGIHGSAALYRQVFDRIVNHDGIRNLVWLWEADTPDDSPDGAGPWSEYFPGLLSVDAVEVSVADLNPWRSPEKALAVFAAGKPFGVEIAGELPAADAPWNHAVWHWFIASPAATAAAAKNGALSRLYGTLQAPSLAPVQ